MPPVIKQQTKVSAEFIDTMLAAYAQWAQLNMPMIQRGGQMGQRLAMTARRLMPIVRRQSPGLREGFDYEVTRLRRMPYTEFRVVYDLNPYTKSDECAWLIGRTKHITMTDYRNRNRIMGEMGSYDVCISSTFVRHPDLSHIHLVPLRNPQATYRHPHHAGHSVGRESPLTRGTGNCWGSYSGVIKGLLDEPDIPELFRQLHNHLCTYGDRPPYHLNMDFDIHTKE